LKLKNNFKFFKKKIDDFDKKIKVGVFLGFLNSPLPKNPVDVGKWVVGANPDSGR
jgi:hypothetical protein